VVLCALPRPGPGFTFKEKKDNMDDNDQREISQSAIDQAPCITFAQVRDLAARKGMTLDDLVERFRGALDRPREVFTRLLDKRHGKVVIPYGAVIAWYQRATAPVLALAAEKACACGCGDKVSGRHKWASPGCRKRVQRKSRTPQKVAV
jgi:hypothetical protein